jgi:PAS domain S-box-containing protein
MVDTNPILATPAENSPLLFMRDLLDSSGHATSLYLAGWTSEPVWLHIGPDVVVGLAYLTIAVALIAFARRRPEPPFARVILMIAVFFISCCAVQFLDAAAFYWPAERVIGIVKLIAAVVTCVIAGRTLSLAPTPPAMERFDELQRENADRKHGETKFRALLESAPDAMVIVDAADRIVLVNSQTERLFGYSRHELLGQEVAVLVPERFRGAHPAHRYAFFAEPESLSNGQGRELFGQRKDGSVFAIEMSSSPLETEDGVLVTTAIRDITERKEAEQKLARQARLLDATHDSIIIRDMDGTITFWNRGAELRYGWTSEEALGRISHSLLRTQFSEPLEEIEDQLFHDRRWEGELVHATRDGGRIVVASQWVLQHDDAGLPRSILEINHDITERTRAEAKFRKLLESASDAMVIFDSAGRIVLINSQTERLFGFSREEILGREVEILMPERFHGASTSDGQPFLLAQEERRIGADRGLFGRRKDGSEFAIEVSLSPLETDQGVLVSSAIRDVTELKQTQALQQRTAQLEVANKELEAFSYSISHDLRAPLRAIDGFSRIVLEEFAEHLPEEGKDYLKSVRGNAQQMGRLVDDLLTFSRLGRLPMLKKDLDTAKIVRQSLEDLSTEREGRRIDITIGDLPRCDAEPILLKQVWINLLSNAIKYTRGRAVANIEIGCRVDADSPGKSTFFVKDNGVGFDMRYVEKLFGVFQRLHRAEDYEGTGVGLAIVQRIIHRHGGRVWAEAQLGQGATFSFTLGT